MAMYPEEEGVFFQLIVQGGGEFVYDVNGNLRSSNVGQVTTDPVQGITCQQGFATYNGHGAVITLLSTSQAAFFQYQDLGSSTQGTLILVIASSGGNDPVKGTAYQAGMNGIDPAFGDFLVAVGATINLGQANYTRNAIVGAHSAPSNPKNPFVQIDAPEQGTATHMQTLLQGTSPDGTSLGQMLIGLVAAAAVLSPVTNGMVEIQGVTSPGAGNPALAIVPNAAADPILGTRIAADTNLRFQSDGNGNLQWGPGNAVADINLNRQAANLLRVVLADFAVTTIGRGLRVREGTNAKQGTAVLVGGTVTVANTSVTANSRIFVGMATPGGTVQAHFVSSVTPGTGFTIKSTSGTDTSTVAYQIFEPG